MDLRVQSFDIENFRGKFIRPERLSKKANKYLNEILTPDSKSLLEKMPFDVEIFCPNPTKKAINPRFTFSINIPEKLNQIGCYGYIHINCKNKMDEIKQKLFVFINEFKQNMDKIDGKKPLSPKEQTILSAERIVLGWFN